MKYNVYAKFQTVNLICTCACKCNKFIWLPNIL